VLETPRPRADGAAKARRLLAVRGRPRRVMLTQLDRSGQPFRPPDRDLGQRALVVLGCPRRRAAQFCHGWADPFSRMRLSVAHCPANWRFSV
jgi:hypothetical protein